MKKKVIGSITGVIGILLLVIGVISKLNEKSEAAVTVIGGADGPTSVFLAGTVGVESLVAIAIGAVFCLVAVFTFVKSRK